jgi:hypothetical protein
MHCLSASEPQSLRSHRSCWCDALLGHLLRWYRVVHPVAVPGRGKWGRGKTRRLVVGIGVSGWCLVRSGHITRSGWRRERRGVEGGGQPCGMSDRCSLLAHLSADIGGIPNGKYFTQMQHYTIRIRQPNQRHPWKSASSPSVGAASTTQATCVVPPFNNGGLFPCRESPSRGVREESGVCADHKSLGIGGKGRQSLVIHPHHDIEGEQKGGCRNKEDEEISPALA